jgi:hypothetical protein
MTLRLGDFGNPSGSLESRASAQVWRSCRSQIELNSHLVGVVEPDKFLLPVSVLFDPAIGNSGAAELLLNHLQFFERTDAKGKMIQTDFFLRIGPRLALIAKSEKYTGTADLVHDAVLGSMRRLPQKHRVEPLRHTQISNTEDQMIDELRIYHGISGSESLSGQKCESMFG